VGAALLIRFLALSGSGEFITNLVYRFCSDPIFLILGIAVIYLVWVCFRTHRRNAANTSNRCATYCRDAGFNLIWFGVFLTKLLEIGMIFASNGNECSLSFKGVVGDKYL